MFQPLPQRIAPRPTPLITNIEDQAPAASVSTNRLVDTIAPASFPMSAADIIHLHTHSPNVPQKAPPRICLQKLWRSWQEITLFYFLTTNVQQCLHPLTLLNSKGSFVLILTVTLLIPYLMLLDTAQVLVTWIPRKLGFCITPRWSLRT